MTNGLKESSFGNLKIRQLSAETTHDFIEWCGLIEGQVGCDLLQFDTRIYKHDLYNKFIDEYPDYAPKAKMTISRTRFYKWLKSFSSFNTNKTLEEEQKDQQFWTITRKGKMSIVHISFKNFLESNGFYKFCPEGSKNYVFVKVTNNLIDHTSEKEIKSLL